MAYQVGQKVCLWHEEVTKEGVIVLKEVIVTITETKTGVPSVFSRKPVAQQSLRGVGDDGKTYEKYWDYWPESQTNDFLTQWSLRDDAEGEDPFWAPKEAVYAHHSLRRHNRLNPSQQLERRDVNGQPILPKGDVAYCEKHDEYRHPGQECFGCLLEQ